MPPSDTSEKGLESLIVMALTGIRRDGEPTGDSAEPPVSYSGAGYIAGDPKDYDREHAVDLVKLLAFLQATQPKTFKQLGIADDGPLRQKFLARLQGEIAKRGIVDVLRNGMKHGSASIDLFYGTPSPGNTKAKERFTANLFSVTRQLRYSRDETQLALDLCLCINGLPIATFSTRLATSTVAGALPSSLTRRTPARVGVPRQQ
jgi:type I restriction enzyme R subunit